MIISDPDIEGHPITLDIEVQFRIGDMVYHRAGGGKPGMVTGYLIRTTGLVYQVTWGEAMGEIGHFGFELSGERPL